MKRKMLLVSMVVLALFAFTPSAWSAGVLNMPPNPINVDHSAWRDYSLGGTFVITLSGIPSGFDLEDGPYPGWCAEDNGKQPVDGARNLFDSTDAAILPASYATVNWNKVNYLLNHKLGTPAQVQLALWYLIGKNSTDPFTPTGLVKTMVDNANAFGGAFVPITGQIVAVLIFGDGYGSSFGNPDNYQDTLIEVRVPPNGCTLTPGYWKTHSINGPAPYDDTWGGREDDTFYSSSKTWYQVLWTPPKGNPYYILSFQFIAAKLNILAGASITPQVNTALAFAEDFFTNNGPSIKLTKQQKNAVIYNAGILDAYNNGYIGPGHCSD
jgi:hypothetical protein